MEASPCSLSEFNIFGARVVFSRDAYRLFAQHVLICMRLIGYAHVAVDAWS